jgi:hypothetical protein
VEHLVQRLLTICVKRAEALRKNLHRLRSLQFPSETAEKLIDFFDGVATFLEQEALAGRTSVLPTESVFARAQFILNALIGVYSHLRFIEGASTPRTPWSVVGPFEKLGGAVHPDAHFIIRPQWTYNYTIRELIQPYKDFLKKNVPKSKQSRVNKLFSGLPSRFYVVSFPGIERKNVLLHAVVGHEFGHPIAKKFFEGDDPKSFLFDIFNAVTKELSAKPSEWAKTTQLAAEVRQHALEEILCDLTQLRLFGPAAIFAMEEFAYNFLLDKLYGWHPPWRYRLRITLDDLTDAHVDQLLSEVRDDVALKVKDRVQTLRKLVQKKDDRVIIDSKVFTRIGFRFAEKAIPKAKALLTKELGKYDLFQGESLGRLSGDVGTLVERLQSRIPPNEIQGDGKDFYPADTPAILNAGWFYTIGYQDSLFNEKTLTKAPATKLIGQFVQEDGAVKRLILRAIEYADLQKEWAEWQAKKKRKGSRR